MGPPKMARRAKGATNSKETNELIKMLQTLLKEKEAANQKLLEDISDLQKQMAILLDRVAIDHGNNKPNDSSSEDEGLTTTDEDMDKDKSSIHSVETVTGASEDDASFETVKSRKARRTERFSSDEEISSNGTQLSSSPVRSPIRTPEEVPAKKAKKNKKQAGKSGLISCDYIDFPPLPSPKPAASISAAPPTDQTKVASPTNFTSPQIAKRPPRPKAIPPIVISNAGKFVSIANLFRSNNIRYSYSVVVRNGIKIFPTSESDFRKATKLLDDNKEPYFTFRFPEEKLNHVILRGMPIHLSKEDISENLVLQGFSPKNIIRWNYPDGSPMPMVLVLLPKSETSIFQVRFVCNFEVRAEARKSKPRGIQCHNCQDHGHVAPCCHIPARCLKCGENHHTSKCTKSRDVPARCANCAGDHPASFSGCPRHPSQLRPRKQSNFKGWGNEDHSRLASSSQEQVPQAVPAQASNETLLSQAQLAQISQLFAEQLKSFMSQAMAFSKQT